MARWPDLPLAITRSNRQIRSETLLIVYDKRSFLLVWQDQREFAVEPLDEEIARAEQQRGLVRTMTVDAGSYWRLRGRGEGRIGDRMSSIPLLVDADAIRACTGFAGRTKVLPIAMRGRAIV